MGLRSYRNFSKSPAKLGLFVPPGAAITTDDDDLAAQLELEGGRQGLRAEGGAARAAADGSAATAAETTPKRAKRAKAPDA